MVEGRDHGERLAAMEVETKALAREQLAQRNLLSTLLDGQRDMQAALTEHLVENNKKADSIRRDLVRAIDQSQRDMMGAVTVRLNGQDGSIDEHDKQIMALTVKHEKADAERKGRQAILSAIYGVVGGAVAFVAGILGDIYSGGAG